MDLKELGLVLRIVAELGVGNAPLALLFLPGVTGKTISMLEFEWQYEKC